MFKRKKFRVLSLLLVVALFLSTLGMSTAEEKAKTRPEDKINPALMELMQKSEAGEKIPVSMWLTDIDQEAVDKTVKREQDSPVTILRLSKNIYQMI